MQKALFEGVKRLIRHGLAPLIAILVAGGFITEEQGVTLTNAFLVIGTTVVTIVWSALRARYPYIAWL